MDNKNTVGFMVLLYHGAFVHLKVQQILKWAPKK
jgi:hypothetical protein